jgi:hypothetical protein
MLEHPYTTQLAIIEPMYLEMAVRTEASRATSEGPSLPRAIVQTCQGPTPHGMGHLRYVAWRADTAEADAEAKDETSSKEHSMVD